MRPTALACLAACLLAAPAAAQQIIDPDPAGLIQNETSLTLIPGAPGMPQLIAVAYNNDPTGATGLGFGESPDGGVTWFNTVLPLPLDPGGSGFAMTDAFDPAAGVDLMGNVYVAHISTLFGYPGANGLFVHRYDWGATGLWMGPYTVSYAPAAVGNPDPSYRFNDKCHLDVDLDPVGGSPFVNNVYVTWIMDGGMNIGPWSDIFFATSMTQGATWTYPGGSAAPVPINDNPYIPGMPGPFDMANGPNIAVGPDGTVFVAWTDIDVTIPQSNANLMLDRSVDAGITWGPDQVIVPNILGCPGNLSSMLGPDARCRSYMAMAASPIVQPNGFYDLYVVYPADPDGMAGPDETDVFFVSSNDCGVTWNPPLRLNTDPTPNDQFQPWIAVKPNGWIDVAWYDRRNAPLDDVWDLVITRSVDGGLTWAPELFLTDPTTVFATPLMPWSERWMGEYLGLGVDTDFAYLAFTSSISDILGDVYFTSIENLAIATAAPELEPPAGTSLRLAPNQPNPFGGTTTLVYSLAVEGPVRLTVHDVGGRLVRVLEDGVRKAGTREVVWDGRDDAGRPATSGPYFCRLKVGEEVLSRKILLVR